ncbi:hypothetical protein UPYG_G00023520, partial [Umbra pygmaea]
MSESLVCEQNSCSTSCRRVNTSSDGRDRRHRDLVFVKSGGDGCTSCSTLNLRSTAAAALGVQEVR